MSANPSNLVTRQTVFGNIAYDKLKKLYKTKELLVGKLSLLCKKCCSRFGACNCRIDNRPQRRWH